MPALTVNPVGAGRCYYLAARPAEDGVHDGLVRGLVREIGIARHLDVKLPEGVTVQKRKGGGRTLLFLHNCTGEERALDLGAIRLVDIVDGSVLTGRVSLRGYASRVLARG
jgi:beta-galactosidase